MTYAGADGETRREMERVLHFPSDEEPVHGSFSALQSTLAEITRRATERARAAGDSSEAVTFNVANRLFGQKDYRFRRPFLDLLQNSYGAPLELMDFVSAPEASRQQINVWVENETRKRIHDLIPPLALDEFTRLVLVNAIYMKARWVKPFSEAATAPRPFRLTQSTVDVPTMRGQGRCGYAKREGYSAVTIPYVGGDIQFLILLPDTSSSLAALEAVVTPELLAESAELASVELIVELPKLKLEPSVMELSEILKSLGMRSAFDLPPGSANFDRMAPRRPDDYLYISEVFHKTFLELDENGTEAAAATAVVVVLKAEVHVAPKEPIEVKIDRPFLFAIQHRASGACLFFGHVTDPR
jgi:serpin B